MNTNKSFDILVPKEYETKHEGQILKKTKWNKVGRAWLSKSFESMSFELFFLPNLRYVIQLGNYQQSPKTETEANSEVKYE